eukprot:2701956-Rhodomonas_salina.2
MYPMLLLTLPILLPIYPTAIHYAPTDIAYAPTLCSYLSDVAYQPTRALRDVQYPLMLAITLHPIVLLVYAMRFPVLMSAMPYLLHAIALRVHAMRCPVLTNTMLLPIARYGPMRAVVAKKLQPATPGQYLPTLSACDICLRYLPTLSAYAINPKP